MRTFFNYEVPIAYSMISVNQATDSLQTEEHPFSQFFCYWTAFNNIYTTIAGENSRRNRLKKQPDGTIETRLNGSVKIPRVIILNERERIDLAFAQFNYSLHHKLITHPSTKFFVERIPRWHGQRIEFDAEGQRVNGGINIDYTVDEDYPVWSPIDIPAYELYLQNHNDIEAQSLLARQILELLYTIRCNLLHGGKRRDDATDIEVVNNALPLLETIVVAFMPDVLSNSR